MDKLKGYVVWAFVLITALAVQALVFGMRLNRKDLQVQALYKNQVVSNRVNQSLLKQVTRLRVKIDELERRVQRLDMKASWYGPGFHGRTTASGTRYDQAGLTCAHRTFPFGTVLVVEYRGKRVTCVVTDRGPFIEGRDIDLSKGVADAVGLTRRGVDKVTVYKVEVT